MIKYDCAADESIDQYQMSKHYFFLQMHSINYIKMKSFKGRGFHF